MASLWARVQTISDSSTSVLTRNLTTLNEEKTGDTPCTTGENVILWVMTRAIETLRLSQLLPAIRDEFDLVPDIRNVDASGHVHPMSDVLMAGLAMMLVQDPSLLEFQNRLEERRRGNNLRTIFGVSKIPKESQFRRVLDPADPSIIQNAFSACVQRLQKTRLWSEYRVLNGRYPVLFDGFEFFRSNKQGCDHCLEFHHRDGRVDYAHQVLAATLAHPTAKRPIPLMLEEIRREDGTQKQDCEFNAARRLIPNLVKQHCHLDLIFVGDGLYSKVPMVNLIIDTGSSYILVAKPTDHVALEENLASLRLCDGVKRLEFTTDKGKRRVYEWVYDVELNGSSSLVTNWFSIAEFAPSGKIIYRNSWITDLKPCKSNIEELVEVGRHRWQIEDQVFDILKNHGYHLEHRFGHGKQHLAFIFIILNFLAYMLHQLIALSDRLFQAAMEKIGTKHKLWDDIRVLLNHFVWGSWDALLEHILDYRDDTGFESG
ncbi:MAG: transposase [Candidatus Riflebacteria bacterium]|nr:transposase [Candidatus Riflebacteria bacterium]